MKEKSMKQWECSVCGYIHEGDVPPQNCPVCQADRDKFFEITTQEAEVPSEVTDAPEKHLSIGEKLADLLVEKHLHAISVHSPNGIIPVAVIFLVLNVVLKLSGLENAIYYNMIAVLVGMPPVIATGYITWQKKYGGAQTSLFKIKIAASCAATVILFGLVIWKTIQPEILSTPSTDRWLFFMWSLLLLATVGVAGHLGGQLVFAKKSSQK
jgi:rubredoxin/uncharacterized membrane protein